MRRAVVVCLALASILSVGASLSGDDGEPLENNARQLVAAMATGDFESVVAHFDAAMTEALPVSRLDEVWQQITAAFGDLKEIDGSRTAAAGAFQAVFVRCTFIKGSLDAKVVYDADGRVAGLFFVPASAAPSPTPAQAAAPPSVSERPVTVGAEPWALPGTLSVPAGGGPFPAVVLVHGSGPQDRDESIGPNKPFRDLAWGLAERGIAVLRYEKRTSQHAEQMARAAQLTVMEETVDDARAAAHLLAGLPEIDSHRVVVLGHSLGGTLVPRIAMGDPEIAGLIIMAGATRPLEELVVSQLEYLAGLDGIVDANEAGQIEKAKHAAAAIADPNLQPGDTVDLLGSKTPGSYWLDLRAYDPAAAAGALSLPIFILQGGRDYQVDAADLDGWRNALDGHPQVRIKVYPQLNHLFMPGSGPSSPQEYATPGHVAAEVLDDVAAWIKEIPASPR